MDKQFSSGHLIDPARLNRPNGEKTNMYEKCKRTAKSWCPHGNGGQKWRKNYHSTKNEEQTQK